MRAAIQPEVRGGRGPEARRCPPDRGEGRSGRARVAKHSRLAAVLPLFHAACPGEVRLVVTSRPRRDSVEGPKAMFKLISAGVERAIACDGRACDAAPAPWAGPVLKVDCDGGGPAPWRRPPACLPRTRLGR